MTELRSGVYRHYKGDHYQLIGIGEHTETREPMVIYVALHARPGPRLRIRPLNGAEGFLTPVELKGQTVPRFTWIGNEIPVERWDADLQPQSRP
jgi:hypothetical protein